MRFKIAIITGLVGLLLSACNPSAPQEEKTDEAARKAGKAAYEVSEKTKEAAKELEREVKKAGKEAQAGWDQAKRESQEKKK